MIENLIDFAVVAMLGLATALACNRLLSAPKAKPDNRQRGFRDEEIEIGPDAVPGFKPTWRDVK